MPHDSLRKRARDGQELRQLERRIMMKVLRRRSYRIYTSEEVPIVSDCAKEERISFCGKVSSSIYYPLPARGQSATRRAKLHTVPTLRHSYQLKNIMVTQLGGFGVFEEI